MIRSDWIQMFGRLGRLKYLSPLPVSAFFRHLASLKCTTLLLNVDVEEQTHQNSHQKWCNGLHVYVGNHGLVWLLISVDTPLYTPWHLGWILTEVWATYRVHPEVGPSLGKDVVAARIVEFSSFSGTCSVAPAGMLGLYLDVVETHS